MDQQQKPTITDIRIRNTNDAHVIFFAVSEGRLPMIKRRLDPDERAQVRPGNCYIWEERSADEEAVGMGMERWTDGLQWGPSRTRDDFLFYIQKSPEDGDGKRLKYGRRRRSQPVVRREPSDVLTPSSPVASSSRPPQLQQAPPPPPTISNAMSVEDNKLVKQTYSVYTKLPGDSENRALRKWHLTAYYTPHAVQSGQLKDITQIPELANLQIPPNRFKAARIGKRGGTTGSENQVPMAGGGPGSTTTTSMYASVTPGGDYIAYGDPHHSHHPHHGHLMGVGAATLEPSRYPPVVRHAPGGSSSGGSSVASSPLHRHHGEVSPTTSARGHHAHLSWPTANGASSPLLPPASALGVGHHTPPIPGYAGPTAGGYHPQLYPPSQQQPPQYPHHPPSGAAYPPPLSGPYPPPPSSQPQYQSYHQPQYSPGPSYPPPPRTSSPLVMSSSPRARISSLPSISTSVSQAQFGHNLPPLPARYPTAYEAQVPQYPPPAKPYDELPHSPAESVHSDFGGAKDVEMQDASGPSGLTTIVENRALPPLDITVSFQARTAEDERTLWALNKGFGKDMK